MISCPCENFGDENSFKPSSNPIKKFKGFLDENFTAVRESKTMTMMSAGTENLQFAFAISSFTSCQESEKFSDFSIIVNIERCS